MAAADMTVPLWIKGKAELEQAWIDAWIETGDVTLAREAVRSHTSYNTYFAGNQRDDGSPFLPRRLPGGACRRRGRKSTIVF